MAETGITVDATGPRNMFRSVISSVTNPKRLVLTKIQKYAQAKSAEVYKKNAHGGIFREVRWAPFAPSSIGSKRPSGKPITNASNLLQDTSTLARRTGSTFSLISAGARFETRLPYAEFQHKIRPALFWIDKDQNPVAEIARKDMEADARKKPGVN